MHSICRCVYADSTCFYHTVRDSITLFDDARHTTTHSGLQTVCVIHIGACSVVLRQPSPAACVLEVTCQGINLLPHLYVSSACSVYMPGWSARTRVRCVKAPWTFRMTSCFEQLTAAASTQPGTQPACTAHQGAATAALQHWKASAACSAWHAYLPCVASGCHSNSCHVQAAAPGCAAGQSSGCSC